MLKSVFNNIKISAIATAVPKRKEVITEKYSKIFGETHVKQFSKTTGVLERRVALEEQTASDFAYVAAERIIVDKKIDRAQIAVCVFITQTPDYRIPATACVLHKRLGLSKDCIVFDVNLGCSGYVYGMQVVASLMQNIECKYGLLLVGDTSNKGIAENDQASAMLFGDSGSATLFEKVEGSKEIKTVYRTDGNGYKAIIIPAGAYRNRNALHDVSVWGDGNERSDYDLYMNGIDVFSFTISEVPSLIKDFIKEENIVLDEFDDFVFHQANCFIIKQVVKLTKIPKDRVPISMDRYGNTSVTSIPLTICDKYGSSIDNRKRSIFSCGFGIGLSWGVTTFEINEKDIYPIIETDDYYKDGAVSHD